MFIVVLILGAAMVALVLFLAMKRFFGRNGEPVSVPPNTVILHQLSRGPYAPSISPFCVKLETYLRMANIKYQNAFGRQMSSKGKYPWIELDGQAVADSQFCINFLNKKFDVDLNKGLSQKDKSIARAFQKLAEESLYWVISLYRFVFMVNKNWLTEAGIPSWFTWYLRRRALKQTWEQGYGRHTREELDQIMTEDMEAISQQLGSKEFMMGPDPTELDCVMFGQLAEFKWNLHSSLASKLVTDDFPNLSAYCERMKTRYWPDWDDCITKGNKNS